MVVAEPPQPWDEKFVSGVPVLNILARVKALYNFPAKVRRCGVWLR